MGFFATWQCIPCFPDSDVLLLLLLLLLLMMMMLMIVVVHRIRGGCPRSFCMR